MKTNNCMFCNSTKVETLSVCTAFGDRDVDGYAVYCDHCGCRGPVKRTRNTSVKCWNRILNEIERLEDLLDGGK